MLEFPRRTALALAGGLVGGSVGTGSATAARDPGVTVTESDGSTVVDEADGTDDYSVVLDDQPAADVTVHVEPDSEVATDVDSLTFTPLDRNEPQQVTVSAVDDPDVEADLHEGAVRHTAESLDPEYDGIEVRDVTVTVRDDDVSIELEGLLSDVDEESEELEVMGSTVDVSDAEIHSPTAELSVSELAGDPLPGRGSTPGFVDGTVEIEGSAPESGGTVHAEAVLAIVAEHVIVGPVTENTISADGSIEDGTFAVQDTVAYPIDDERLPLEAGIEGTGGLTVDLGSIPEGTVCTLEGYYAQDGTHHPYVIATETGDALGDQTAISRARCGSSDELRIQGASSTAPETITFYDADTGEELGTTNATLDSESGVGSFEFRREISELPSGSCPEAVRAENSNGSEAVADVS